MFTFTGVPAFLKALMYACTLVSTSPKVSESPHFLNAIRFTSGTVAPLCFAFFNTSK